jgi:hypothetical protein
MNAFTSIKLASLMVISSASLMACGDSEDYYLEPGYGHNFGHEAEMVQLAQVVTDEGLERPWLATPDSTPDTLLMGALRAQENTAQIETAFDFNEALNDETLNAALGGNPLEVTPPLNAPNDLEIHSMTPEELERTCTAIDSIFDGMDSVDMNTADCTANRIENVRSVSNEGRDTCNAVMSKCIDTAEPFAQPAAFCQTPNKVPTECDIDYTEITSCLRTFKDSQVQLEAMNICDDGALISAEADAQYVQHQAAQACLIKLDTHCPSFLQD